MLCAVGQFAAVMFKAYQAEREWNAMRRDFQEHWAAWRTQNIQTYSVTYNNCNYYFCCQGEHLEIEGGVVTQIPACGGGTAGYSQYERVVSVGETYIALDEWMRYHHGEPIKIEYHPNLHYITRAEFQDWSGTVIIEYRDLLPK